MSTMTLGVLNEADSGEARVAATPNTVTRLVEKLGYNVLITKGAGKKAGFADRDYVKAGAKIAANQTDLFKKCDGILAVNAPIGSAADLRRLKNKTIISLFWPAQHPTQVKTLAANQTTVLAMDCVPRISRAQKLDVLSSMANVGGYRAVIEASHEIGRFLSGQMTAAGKIPPTTVLVIGAGVAGLAAIGTATSMGAVVRAFDTRMEAKEQVESLNAEFLVLDFEENTSSEDGYAQTMSKAFIDAEMALFAQQAKEVDVIITTALIPGKDAPLLITKEMVDSMRPGSVIVDMAAERGGNCAYTVPGKKKTVKGVTILGYTDLPGRMPKQASELYATNVFNLLDEITPDQDGQMRLDMADEMIRNLTVINQGEVMWPPPPIKVSAAAPKPKEPATKLADADALPEPKQQRRWTLIGAALAALLLLGVGATAPPEFMAHFTVFVLACFVGWQVVWNVTPALHTPLMSVTNAISGIIVLGALLQVDAPSATAMILACAATLLASINISGGFLVTRRMLKMFQK